jgi:hypothetical protein
MNGRQLADEARQRIASLLVLFTTGYTGNAVIHQGRLDPGVRLICKPLYLRCLGLREFSASLGV